MSSTAIFVGIVLLAVALGVGYYILEGRYEDEYRYHSIEKHTKDKDTQ